MKNKIFNLIILIIICSNIKLNAENWNTWRGPEQNSRSNETGLNIELPYNGSVWEKNIGLGYSTVSVYNKNLFTAGHDANTEKNYVYCLDALTGKENWRYFYTIERGTSYTGPLATPVTDGKYVYHLSRYGVLICLNLESGELVWKVDTINSYGGEIRDYGVSSTPILVNNMIIINVGIRGMAFNRYNGKVIWYSKGKGNYSTVKPFKYKNNNYLAYMSFLEFYILELETGKAVASVEWRTPYDLVIIDPVINRDGSLIYISSPYNNGGALFKFDGTNLKQLWKNRNMRSMYNTPILVEGNEIGTGTLYGVDGDNGSGRFAAIDFKTGELKYRSRLRFGNFIMADNKFIYNIERGKLVFIKPDSNRFIELKSGRVIIEGKLWNIPVLANGYIYCRSSSGKLVCLKVK